MLHRVPENRNRFSFWSYYSRDRRNPSYRPERHWLPVNRVHSDRSHISFRARSDRWWLVWWRKECYIVGAGIPLGRRNCSIIIEMVRTTLDDSEFRWRFRVCVCVCVCVCVRQVDTWFFWIGAHLPAWTWVKLVRTISATKATRVQRLRHDSPPIPVDIVAALCVCVRVCVCVCVCVRFVSVNSSFAEILYE